MTTETSSQLAVTGQQPYHLALIFIILQASLIHILLNQQIPQAILLNKSMMNNINQPILFPNPTQQLRSCRSGRIHMLPLPPNTESFFSPSTEGNGLNNRWCNDFFARKRSPRYWVHRLSICGFEIASRIGGEKCDFIREFFEFAFKFGPVCGWEEDFDERLGKSALVVLISTAA